MAITQAQANKEIMGELKSSRVKATTEEKAKILGSTLTLEQLEIGKGKNKETGEYAPYITLVVKEHEGKYFNFPTTVSNYFEKLLQTYSMEDLKGTKFKLEKLPHPSIAGQSYYSTEIL